MLALAFERPALDGELADIEVGLVLENGVENATEPMGDCHQRHLVAMPGGKLRKYRLSG